VQIRTSFSEMRLFNDDLQNMARPFYSQWKSLGHRQDREREREKERRVRGRAWVKKGWGMGYELDYWSSYLRGSQDGINLDEY
jgi:hypothetical protein